MVAAPLTSRQWLFALLVAASLAAFTLSVSVVSMCDFVGREVRLTRNATAYCDASAGGSAESVDFETNRPVCQVLSALNHSVGFFGFAAPMPSSDSYACFSYSRVFDGACGKQFSSSGRKEKRRSLLSAFPRTFSSFPRSFSSSCFFPAAVEQ
jgi:hypothetical protein